MSVEQQRVTLERDEPAPPSTVLRRAIAAIAGGALLLLASMFVPRVRAEAGEDFFGDYYHADGPPSGLDEMPAVNAWFFTLPAFGTLLLVLDGPPFTRLPATWVAMAAALVTACGLAALWAAARTRT